MAAAGSRVPAFRRVLLSLWVGGLATIDLVETPTRFTVKEVNRNQTIAIGRRVFAATNRMEVGLGTLLLLLLRGKDAHAARSQIIPMWTIALSQLIVLQPKMIQAGEGLDFEDRDRSDPRFAQHRKLHQAYVALDGLKLVLGVWAILSEDA
jgi:uncharacterized protein DUF4149